MWVFPLVAAAIAFAFAVRLAARWRIRRTHHEILWVIALVMYGVASAFVALGVADGWTSSRFAVYWALGAVLNVPFLAGGEVLLLVRAPWARWVTWLALVFLSAYTVSTLRAATFDPTALQAVLPSGKEVFGDGTPAHRLPQLIAIPSYLLLLGGALWSAWRMRGRPEARDRFIGTLLIALGATVIAGFASAFAALGTQAPFSISLAVGISVMFAGFLRATRRAPAAAASV